MLQVNISKYNKVLLLAVALLAALALHSAPALAKVDKQEWNDRFNKLGCMFAGALERDGQVSAWGVVTDPAPLAKLGFKDPAKSMVLRLKPMGNGKYQSSLGFRGRGQERQKLVLELDHN